VVQGDSMLVQSGSSAWEVRAGKGGKCGLGRNFGKRKYKTRLIPLSNACKYSVRALVRLCLSEEGP
jgi:hypothetical protein